VCYVWWLQWRFQTASSNSNSRSLLWTPVCSPVPPLRRVWVNTVGSSFPASSARAEMLLLDMAQCKSYKESLKVLEADIQHANTL
jgi:hypothetical protein